MKYIWVLILLIVTVASILVVGEEDKGNDIVLAVDIVEDRPYPRFARKYLVSKITGKVVYSYSLINEALYRQIYDCSGDYGPDNDCVPYRFENERPRVGPNWLNDEVYDTMGRVYGYWWNYFRRDSFDGIGSSLTVASRWSSCSRSETGETLAFYHDRVIYACFGGSAIGPLTHESTHGVIRTEIPDIQYKNQTGAIEEALGDIAGADAEGEGNWTYKSREGNVIHQLDRPEAQRRPSKIYHPNYYCSEDDHGGVHTNSGILAKAFYLASRGGVYNECGIAGMGRDKVRRIAYRYMAVYMGPNDNYYDLYQKLLGSCFDLYAFEHCAGGVWTALTATEMDQQWAESQKSPWCQGFQANDATCKPPPRPPRPTKTPEPEKEVEEAKKETGEWANKYSSCLAVYRAGGGAGCLFSGL